MKKFGCLLLIIIAGCFPPLPNDNRNDGKKPVEPIQPEYVAEHPPAQEIWLKLAHACEGDQPLITDMPRLNQYVKTLYRLGDLTDADILKYDAAFPKSARSERKLTSDDIETLKGLK